MIPDLQCSFACEDVRVEAAGAHTVVGILNGIATPKLPVRLLKLCVWTRWCSGTGDYTQHTRLVLPDEATVLADISTKFTLPHVDQPTTNVNIFPGIEFREPGVYHFEILLDDKLRLRYPLQVRQLQPKA
ncbi:MAG: hypothetical protein AAGK14_11140 [Verrucomicrobiota bacterium]